MRRIRPAVTVAALAMAVVVAACGILAANVPQVSLEVRSLPGEALGFEPSTIIAPPATRVAVAFENRSTLEHNLVFLEPLDARTREILRAGEVDRLELTTPAPGNYDFVCTIHMEMRGMLIVT